MNICNCYRPEMIVLGGGIGEGLKDYIKLINKKFALKFYFVNKNLKAIKKYDLVVLK